MPETAYLYAIPYELYQQHSIRKYGFHGTSHYYVANRAAEILGKPLSQCHFISAHLGNGCSVTAIKNGNSVDSSMGFTPLEGVMMGSRSGSIDPGIIFFLIEQLGYTPEQVNHLLNKESGLLGVSGLSNDCRTLEHIFIIEGLIPTTRQPYAGRINRDVARALSAEIVLVAAPDNDSPDEFQDRIEVSAETYGGIKNKRLIGCIINKINAPDQDQYGLLPKEHEIDPAPDITPWLDLAIFKKRHFALLGAIPWNLDLIAPRVIDLSNYLQAKVLNAGDMRHRRIRSISFCARSVDNLAGHLIPSRLIVTPGDRTDIIIATCLSSLNGTKVGALILTNGFEPCQQVMSLCQQALDGGLPVLSVPWDTWQTSRHLMNLNPEIPPDDSQRQERVKQYVADHIEQKWRQRLLQETDHANLLSPTAFRHKLTELAKSANKLIVLPEGNDVRTIKAAAICTERGIARCLLLGNKEEISLIAEQQGINLPENLRIVDPGEMTDRYVGPMVALRHHKGLTDIVAREELKDNVVLATMMLQLGEVDGLVSGAVHTTANTIRPALQLIKTAPGCSLVSSIFFMLLPEQVLVYGDCAINPEPNAGQLADIAIQSADSARKFGLEPVVAQQKAPQSRVAGKANVFIFPDLNTGNTTYKAVQRSADLVSIGPMLQGMNKPVNDLSRGALVDDIVYTIALTAIQAMK